MDMKLKKMIEELEIESDYIDENFVDEIEIFLIPLRKEIEKYPEALGKILEIDKKIIQAYKKINDKYLKEILTPIYKLALKNVKRDKKVA